MSDRARVTHQVRIVDVFTEKALAGNQLAVVLDGKDLTAKLMQRIARELNFSETTFILPPDDPAHAAKVRIFVWHEGAKGKWLTAKEGDEIELKQGENTMNFPLKPE